MSVVSNASPLIALSAIRQHELLARLFGQVLVPTATLQELHAGLSLPHREALLRSEWLVARQVVNHDLVTAFRQTLGAGEAESIALAIELKASVLLMDERLGRRVAARYEIPLLGVIGILVLAKHRGLIASVRPLLDELRSNAGFYISGTLMTTVLADCDEQTPP